MMYIYTSSDGCCLSPYLMRIVLELSSHVQIGVVPQDVVLFNESMYYNIAYGNTEASREEV